MVWDNDDRAKFENDLINQRLTWLGTFEGLLFVANSYGKHPYLLPFVGIAIAVSVGRGTYSANRALLRLPRAEPQASDRWSFLMPGTSIPPVIAVVWAILFMQNFKWWRSLFSCLASSLGF
jgi:hypothetical protein